MLYVILGHDGPGALTARKAARTAHIEYLRGLQISGSAVIAGTRPRAESAGALEAGFYGDLIIGEFISLAAARAWAEQDPYFIAGVFERVEVQPFVQLQLA